jgi:hypothetical protein
MGFRYDRLKLVIMKFIIKGHFETAVDTKNISEFPQIKINDNANLKLIHEERVESSRYIPVGFELEIDSDSQSGAEETGRELLENIVSYFSFHFDVPVYGWYIKEVQNVEEKKRTGLNTLACSVFLVRSLDLNKIREFDEELPKILKPLNSLNIFCSYNKALKSTNPEEKFKILYDNILSVLFKKTEEIEKEIIKRRSDLKKDIKDNQKREMTIYTAIRHKYHHPTATYFLADGKKFDMDEALRENLENFRKLVREIINDTAV